MNRTRTTFQALVLMLTVSLASFATSQVIYVDAGGGGDFTTIQAAVDALTTPGTTIQIAGGSYTEGAVIVNGLALNNVTISGDPNNRPVLDKGFVFRNDTHSGLTIENLVVNGRLGTGSPNTYMFLFEKNGAGRTDLTIQNCKFDGQGVASTNGFYVSRILGTFTFDNNELTGLTGNVALSPTGAGSAEAAFGMPDTVYITNNHLHNMTGAIDVRGKHTIDSFEGLPGGPPAGAEKNPIAWFVGNVFDTSFQTTENPGGAFKLFHTSEGYFIDNFIRGISITSNGYTQIDPGADYEPRGAGLLYLNVGKLVVSGNTFEDCLQALAHDPHNTLIGPNNNTPPLIFQVFNNTFTNNKYAIYFPSSTTPGTNQTGGGSYVSGSTTSTLEIYDNNFSNNYGASVYVQTPDPNLDIDASGNFWGSGVGPDPGDIVFVYPEGPSIDTSDPDLNINLLDSDGDGLTDGAEIYIHGTDPNLKDTDGDGFEDGLEVLMGWDPLDPDSPNVQGDPPTVPPIDYELDSDGDGYPDWYELTRGTDPNDENDFPLLGDATGDGKVDNVDAIVIVAIVLKVAGFDINRFNFNDMDINRDGKITNVDAIQLLNFFLGNIPRIPTN